jgi:hypothetical protein
MRAVLLLVFACGCNAIDGVDQYKHADGQATTCQPSCIATSGNCLAECAATRDACKGASSCNPGCQNKCDSNYGSCTSACVTTCTDCACSQTDCETATPVDAGTGG